MGLRSQNNPIAAYLDVFSKTGTDASAGVPILTGLEATGGIISDIVDGSTVYRAHIFSSSGTFEVTSLSSGYPNNIDFLQIAGGGGGGAGGGGGGGAGGFYSTDPAIPAPNRASPVTVSVQSYPVIIGAGGVGGPQISFDNGFPGGTTSFNGVTLQGGGGGGLPSSDTLGPGENGGSGGGGSGILGLGCQGKWCPSDCYMERHPPPCEMVRGCQNQRNFIHCHFWKCGDRLVVVWHEYAGCGTSLLWIHG